jgi:hypothetical protein
VSGGLFGGVFALQLLLVLTASCRRGAKPLRAFTPTVFWLLLCVVIHCWLEFSFVFRRTGHVTGFQNSMNLYGAADYRYGFGEQLELEPGTAAMEAITALVTGPLCLLLAWGIVGDKAWRWSVQVLVCTCQMYGLAWFAAHPFFSVEPCSSSDPFLYCQLTWKREGQAASSCPISHLLPFLSHVMCAAAGVVFVGFNAPWGIVPPILLLQALFKINSALSKAQAQEVGNAKALKAAKTNGQAAAAVVQQQQQRASKK